MQLNNGFCHSFSYKSKKHIGIKYSKMWLQEWNERNMISDWLSAYNKSIRHKELMAYDGRNQPRDDHYFSL